MPTRLQGDCTLSRELSGDVLQGGKESVTELQPRADGRGKEDARVVVKHPAQLPPLLEAAGCGSGRGRMAGFRTSELIGGFGPWG